MPIGTRPAARSRLLTTVAVGIGALLAGDVSVAGRETDGRRMAAEETHMGVVVRLDAYLPPSVNPARAFRAAFDRIAVLAKAFSSFQPDSEVRRLAEQAWRKPVRISSELAFVLDHALRLARETGGAFDPTLGQVTGLLRRSGDRDGAQEWRKAWRQTGWRHLVLDPTNNTLFLRRRGLQLDLGGIAKGYIGDEALRELERHGVPSALVAVAGDIVAGAPPPGEAGWKVALDAVGERGSLERTVVLLRQAVSTSGSRERHYEINNRRCSHIVAPPRKHCVTALPAVSVVAPSGLEADALATALAVLGPSASKPILERHPRVRVYWAPSGPGDEAAPCSRGAWLGPIRGSQRRMPPSRPAMFDTMLTLLGNAKRINFALPPPR